MPETTWIIDETTGALTVEGLSNASLSALTDEYLPPSVAVNCARPLHSSAVKELSFLPTASPISMRVLRIYHHSVVEGPGRRSVLQTAGCEKKCSGCYVPETHDVNGGTLLSVADIASSLLADEGAPRDGVTILGGEPFLQLNALLELLQILKGQGQHLTLYSGFTLEELQARSDARILKILTLTDILIDGPFVKELSANVGEWRGSTNQRILHQPARYQRI